MKTGKRFGWISLAAAGLAFAGPVTRDRPVIVASSPHLYETYIRVLREIGADSDAFELLRRQFRIAARETDSGQPG